MRKGQRHLFDSVKDVEDYKEIFKTEEIVLFKKKLDKRYSEYRKLQKEYRRMLKKVDEKLNRMEKLKKEYENN